MSDFLLCFHTLFCHHLLEAVLARRMSFILTNKICLSPGECKPFFSLCNGTRHMQEPFPTPRAAQSLSPTL